MWIYQAGMWIYSKGCGYTMLPSCLQGCGYTMEKMWIYYQYQKKGYKMPQQSLNSLSTISQWSVRLSSISLLLLLGLNSYLISLCQAIRLSSISLLLPLGLATYLMAIRLSSISLLLSLGLASYLNSQCQVSRLTSISLSCSLQVLQAISLVYVRPSAIAPSLSYLSIPSLIFFQFSKFQTLHY